MLISIVGELLDFVWKALVHYGRTPEGAKEFDDIYRAASQATSQPSSAQAATTSQGDQSIYSTSSRVVRG